MAKIIIVMRGISGAGKSTWIKNNVPDAVVCSADLWFSRGGTYKFVPSQLGAAHNSCVEAFKKALADDSEVIVVDNTNLVRKHYKIYLDLASKAGYTVFQKCLKTRFVNVHGVPESKVDEMAQSFQTDNTLPEYPEKELVV